MNITDAAATPAAQSPTFVEISHGATGTFGDETSPYHQRAHVDISIKSSQKIEKVIVTHLGFHAYSNGKKDIRHRGDFYFSGAFLLPNCAACVSFVPFALKIENAGDGFLKVNVRLHGGTDRCKITLLQETKVPRDIDDFVKIESIWYATVLVRANQRIIIEES